MNLPNTLTVIRIFLTFLFIYLMGQEGIGAKAYASLIFVLASLTDFYDGYYARKHNLITCFGKIMDPIADKFLMLSAFFLFMQMHIIAAWMFWIIFIREVGITIWRFIAMKKGSVLAAEKLGKYKTVLQIAAIGIILTYIILSESQLPGHWLAKLMGGLSYGIYTIMLFAVGLTLISGGTYVWNTFRQTR